MRKRAATAGWGRPNGLRWGTWLAILALALNALVPVHFAFDLAEALTPPGRQMPDEKRGLEWRLLALFSGHFDCDGKPEQPDKPDQTNCAVCNSVGSLCGVAPTALSALPVPVAFAVAVLVAPTSEPAPGFAAAYLSRAPPLA